MYTAQDLVKKEAAEGRVVALNRQKRSVEVDGSAVFTQGKEDSGGTFSGAFAHLALP